MEHTCQIIVNRLQEISQCKIVRLTLYFVETVTGKLFLSHSAECLYAVERGRQARSKSPDQLKLNRSTLATNSISDSGDKSEIDISMRPAHTIGRHSDERMAIRSTRTAPQIDDKLVDLILEVNCHNICFILP